MFAIYVYNPVVYHLSTLSVSIPRLRSGSKYNLHRNSSTNSNDAVPTAFKNLVGQLNLNHVHAAELHSPFLPNEGRGTPGRHWRQSFVVDSFLNKCDHSINLSPLHNAPLQRCQRGLSFVLNNRFAFAHQVRFFRSQRSIRNGSSHTPSFTDRLKSVFIASPLKKSNFMGSGASVDLLKEPEKMRLKLAFAEGYEAGKGKAGKSGPLSRVIFSIIFVLLLLASFAVIASATGSAVFKIQFNNQVEVNPEEIDVTFDDVKGTDEAKQELKDIVEFLKYPDKFSALGAKLPKGALLVGPPGTGKTLLARAVAGEAGVPFFHAAGSEFDEVLVGQGARRVRDLFAAAKTKAPCVIFIDEIDAVGGKRTNSVLHPYANQTINQLLSEMDGFHQNEGVIVLGATNRREDLDRALLRPGRFDVEVHINVPDFTGRKDIFELYLKKIQCKNIDIDVLARGTTGFTGADIENMVNLAALQAAINNAKFVAMNDLENARDKVLMGPARKRCPDDEANEVTAYHESGHAIVAYFTKDAIPIHKVTIIPRGPSGGHTSFLPKKERYYTRKSEMLASMDAMMGGRAAEELVFGADKITSGAANDLKQATDIATEMVKEFGMSDKIGLRRIETNHGAYISVNEISPSTTELIDQEIKKLLQDSYERAKSILKTHAKEHKQLAEALLKYETLDADDVKAILNPTPVSS